MAANPFQVQARLRKQIYLAVIVALFTISLLYRRQIVVAQAQDLQLLETARGEVELTSSALRLVLTGSRGLAVTALWKAAIDEQAKHKWNEVELLVGSITKLQPYFITPWLFQSWNMSFNVAVECDKPRDKYYYVSRGLQLLAEGERRNQGLLDKEGRPRFPGNPDMRHNIGFFYQLKIGTSDEKNAMQSLLYMSTIDPVERDPDALWAPGKQGRDVDLKKFEKFCRDHPRLVRRLYDALDYTTPKAIVGFLKDNQTIPGRFSDKRKLSGASELPERTAQFPILPPKVADSPLPGPLQGFWPDADSAALTPEALDAFLVARTWFTYAQLPLPPAFADVGAVDPPFDPLTQRLPKYMTTVIFRGYPCLAQQAIAENLQKEGWFDEDGWTIKEWFDSTQEGEDFRVGVEPKYHSGPAWKKAYQLYRDHGIKNGLYILPEARAELRRKAATYQKRFKVMPGNRDQHPELLTNSALADNYKAHQKLAWNDHYRYLTNFDAHLFECEAEHDPRAIRGRKRFFQALQQGRSGAIPQAIASYESALPVWTDLLLDYPRYRRISSTQEDLYEAELKYLRYLQRDKAATLRTISMLVAQLGCWPNLPPFDTPFDSLLSESQKLAIIPIRKFYGPLDRIMLFDVDFLVHRRMDAHQEESHEAEFKRVLLTWSQLGLPFPMLVYPGQSNLQLSHAVAWPEASPSSSWLPLISAHTIDMVRQRMNLPALVERHTPPGPMAGMPGMKAPPGMTK